MAWHITPQQFYMLQKLSFLLACFFINGDTMLMNIPKQAPFSYDLGIKHISGKNKNSELTICCHGYGHNNSIVNTIASYKVFFGHLIGFNFPDYNISSKTNHNKSAYGTIDEILPLLYLINYYVCDLKVTRLNLYGFSAGSGAIVNALVILNKRLYQNSLNQIGISEDNVKQMLTALERGQIILDCPLKSVEEIIALRGATPELEIMAAHYTKNNMNPIDSLHLLSGLTLHIILHFQNPDDVLGNRDDKLFIEQLQSANKGITEVIIGSDGGHNTYHAELWNIIKNQTVHLA